jgi:hypothetical protein
MVDNFHCGPYNFESARKSELRLVETKQRAQRGNGGGQMAGHHPEINTSTSSPQGPFHLFRLCMFNDFEHRSAWQYQEIAYDLFARFDHNLE